MHPTLSFYYDSVIQFHENHTLKFPIFRWAATADRARAFYYFSVLYNPVISFNFSKKPRLRGELICQLTGTDW